MNRSGADLEFQKKPVVIEVFRLGIDPSPDWFMDRVSTNAIVLHGGHPLDRDSLRSAHIHTLEGVMVADRGDYIIRGVKGEIYPCKPDIFAAIYRDLHAESEGRG